MNVFRKTAALGFPLAMPLALLLSTTPVNAHDTRSGRSVTFEVSSKQPWTVSPVTVHQGEIITITASGTISWQPKRRRVTPNGLRFFNYTCASSQYSGIAFQAPGINCWSLVGRIGQTNVSFLVGTSFKLRSPTSGRLYLGFNDNAYSDNSGRFSVTVTTQ